MGSFKIRNFGRAAAALSIAAMTAAAAPTAASAQGIGGVTSCAAPGGKQEAGALIGALAGGLIGNKVGGRRATGETLIGAAVGAAAGSAIGCQMQHDRAKKYGYDRRYDRGYYGERRYRNYDNVRYGYYR